MLGEQFVKNYCLPLEDQFLDSAQLIDGVRLPPPELEIIVLSLRILLKYRDRDVVKDLIRYRTAGISPQFVRELQWLLGRTSRERIADVLAGISHVVPADLILTFLGLAMSGREAGLMLYRLRSRVRNALRPYQRHDRAAASASYFREIWRRQVSRRFRPAPGMTLPDRGLSIALVGADGSGKTTLCGMLEKWLSWRMDVHSYYLGSKKPSRLSSWLYMAFRMSRRGETELGKQSGPASWVVRPLAAMRRFFLYAHSLSIAHDRYNRYVQGKEKAWHGSIVIFDRFPYRFPLDGPEIRHKANGDQGGLVDYFAGREERLYERFAPADHTILLNVTPQVSQQRKPDHTLETIWMKDGSVQELQSELSDKGASNWTRQNADLPLEEVLLQLKRKIWALL